jgi:hypothetical protein
MTRAALSQDKALSRPLARKKACDPNAGAGQSKPLTKHGPSAPQFRGAMAFARAPDKPDAQVPAVGFIASMRQAISAIFRGKADAQKAA